MRLRHCVATVAAAVLIAGLTAPLSAQYFGRNKVHFKKFDFQVLKTEHFDIYYYPEGREGVEIAARMAERWRARLGRLLNHELRGRQPLVLYASHPHFEQTNTIQGELGESTGGVTEALRRRIVLPLAGPLADTDHVIGHEIVHAYQYDIASNPNAPPGQSGLNALPLWFIEGMAEYLSIGPVDSHTALWLRDAARIRDGKDSLPEIDDLSGSEYFPYRWGQAFWAYVGGRFGDDVIPDMLKIAAASGDVDLAIQRVLGIQTRALSDDWLASLRSAYATPPAAATPPSETGRLIVGGGTALGDDLNVAPSLSPDGRWLAFLSSRSIFSIDFFVADTATGKVVRKLTSTATDPHFSSLQFIHSAGAWDARSERLAIATVTSGRPALVLFEARTGDRLREIALPDVDEIFNPTWAPDGRAICFTGMSHGLTDLYIYELESSRLRRLTTDAFAEVQPAWSPDGQRIAFATDRFSTDLSTLDIGRYRLAVIDPASGAIQPVVAFPDGKHINPQWTPDSRSLLFVSDRDGRPNVYRVAVDGGGVSQITSVSTGVTGITSSSPALSAASAAGVTAFTVYDHGKYAIYLRDDVRGRAVAPAAAGSAALPPADRRRSDVQALLERPQQGLPAPTTYPTAKYSPTLALEGVAQPTVSVGANSFGAAIGGGIALQFSDTLGDHTLITAVQLNSGASSNFSAKNTAAQVMYLNQSRRWNWGLIAGQVPYLSGVQQSGITENNGEPIQVDQSILFRQTEQSATGILAYPFSRAQRIEFQGGVSRFSFDRIVETNAYSLISGAQLASDSTTTSLGDPLTLGVASAALVFDTSSFGATSPVQGQRYRFEAAPTFGALQYTNLLADYRRYFMPAPFYTLAARVMHTGRYGSGGEDERLSPLFLGYPNLVRGYDVSTFRDADCIPTLRSACPAFDRLMGSRLLVANLEFRFPLFRPFGASQQMYGPIPMELAFFADGGVVWNRGERPSIFGGSREGVGSAGVALRVNLFGYAVGQFDFARPFQRPGQGWVFQFNLSPGF